MVPSGIWIYFLFASACTQTVSLFFAFVLDESYNNPPDTIIPACVMFVALWIYFVFMYGLQGQYRDFKDLQEIQSTIRRELFVTQMKQRSGSLGSSDQLVIPKEVMPYSFKNWSRTVLCNMYRVVDTAQSIASGMIALAIVVVFVAAMAYRMNTQEIRPLTITEIGYMFSLMWLCFGVVIFFIERYFVSVMLEQ